MMQIEVGYYIYHIDYIGISCVIYVVLTCRREHNVRNPT